MNIDIQARGFELTTGLREHTLQKLRSAIDWASDEVRTIHVRLSDINGPRGGNDKCCLIHIPIAGKPDVIIQDIENDLYAAIDRATQRVDRVLARKLGRIRAFSRQRFTVESAALHEVSPTEEGKIADLSLYRQLH